MQICCFSVGEVSRTVGGKEWCKNGSRCVSVLRARFAVGDQSYFLAEVFIEAANDLKTNRIKLPCESTYVFDVNKYPPKPLPKMKTGSLERRPRTGSRTHRRRPRRGVASAVNAVTINLHVSSMKFGLIGKMTLTWYSEISSHMLSSRMGTALARLDNRIGYQMLCPQR